MIKRQWDYNLPPDPEKAMRTLGIDRFTRHGRSKPPRLAWCEKCNKGMANRLITEHRRNCTGKVGV